MKNDIWNPTGPGALPEAAGEAGAASPRRSPLLDAKVMMVDDEPLMIDLIQTYLEEEGYANVVATSRPAEALAMLRRERPAVLLLDLIMPELSGFALLETIRADHELRYTPVIVLTASSGADSKLRALQLGATDFLAKPVDRSELVLRVRNTLAFKQYHDRMTLFDQTTGLPNERLFEDSVQALLAQRAPAEGLLALMSITVPECRQLRETLGRDLAEDLAVVLARRLERLAQPVAMSGSASNATYRNPRVARLSETHFAAVFVPLRDTKAVEATAARVLASLAEPVILGTHEVAPLPWIGVAVAPDDGGTPLTLRQSADLAASHARTVGTAQIAYASPELNQRSYQRLTLGAQLRGAVRRGELRLHYQPKVDFATGRVVGVEALLRWQHPERGLVQPLEFIGLAEELGLMGCIGEWVLHTACRDMAALRPHGLADGNVCVNISKSQIVADDLVQIVREALERSGLPPAHLLVELTESLLMDDVARCLALMQALRAMGVQLAIDDFGTGYSSLAYLKQFPVDELKIDRSFVQDLPGQARDRALVRTVIELGHSLGMTVTAEGVESAAQRDCLAGLDCDVYQGFLFSRPVPLERCMALLEAGPR